MFRDLTMPGPQVDALHRCPQQAGHHAKDGPLFWREVTGPLKGQATYAYDFASSGDRQIYCLRASRERQVCLDLLTVRTNRWNGPCFTGGEEQWSAVDRLRGGAGSIDWCAVQVPRHVEGVPAMPQHPKAALSGQGQYQSLRAERFHETVPCSPYNVVHRGSLIQQFG